GTLRLADLLAEFLLDLAQRDRRGRCGRATHSVLQVRPSRSISRSASIGPQVPHWYSGRSRARSRSQYSRIGITNFHAVSTASARMKLVASPPITSRISRSYASGDDRPNAEM